MKKERSVGKNKNKSSHGHSFPLVVFYILDEPKGKPPVEMNGKILRKVELFLINISLSYGWHFHFTFANQR
jgi:hypothetical protein